MYIKKKLCLYGYHITHILNGINTNINYKIRYLLRKNNR